MKKYLQLLIALQIVQSLFESLNNQYSSTDEDWEQQIRMLRRVDRAR